MIADSERLARVVLSRVGEPGDPRLTRLVRDLGAAELVRQLAEQRDPGGAGADLAARLTAVDAERELAQAERLGLRFVVPGDAEWPRQLDDLEHAEPLQQMGGVPIGLWVKGPLRLHELGTPVAVVGSRSSTGYGTSVAGEIAATVVLAGGTLVSGGAVGVDQAAHRGAIAMTGPTVAFLACGADRIYPTANAALLRHIAAEGAVVSEAAPGCSPQRHRFLSRNRLISALSRGTVVVEASVRSGALNTANWANRTSRVVMGVPGPVTSATSGGVHQLIRDGGATLVTCGREVMEAVGAAGAHMVARPCADDGPRDRLDARQRQVLDAVPVGAGAAVDSIARTAGLNLLTVQSALAHLQRCALVERDGVGWRLGELGRA